MAWSWYDNRYSRDGGSPKAKGTRSGWTAALLVGLVLLPALVGAAALPQHEVQEITRLGHARGLSNEQVHRLLDQASHAGERGLPPRTILNKIKEGLAKGVPPARVAPVLKDMVGRLEMAREVLSDLSRSGKGRNGGQQHAMEVLAEALGRGVNPDDVRALGRVGRKGQWNRDALAFGAKGLALTKEAGLSGKEGIAVVGEAVRQGYRPNEILDLGREIKKHRHEFRQDRSRLHSLKQALERGERSDKIFRTHSRQESRRGKGDGHSLRERNTGQEREEGRKKTRDRNMRRERVRSEHRGDQDQQPNRRDSHERMRPADVQPNRRDSHERIRPADVQPNRRDSHERMRPADVQPNRRDSHERMRPADVQPNRRDSHERMRPADVQPNRRDSHERMRPPDVRHDRREHSGAESGKRDH